MKPKEEKAKSSQPFTHSKAVVLVKTFIQLIQQSFHILFFLRRLLIHIEWVMEIRDRIPPPAIPPTAQSRRG